MRVTLPKAGSALAALLAGALLAGCGSSSARPPAVAAESPEQIVAAARAAALASATVRVSGSMIAAGRPISIEMQLVNGKGGEGTVAIDGLTLNLVAIEREAYVNGGAELYRRIAGPVAAAALHGRWIKVPANSGDFSPLYSLASVQGLIDTTLAGHGTLAHAAPATIEGQRAVAVHDVDRGGTLYVAATGTPYPLEITRPGGGAITFTRWNQAVTLQPPPDWVNINALSR